MVTLARRQKAEERKKRKEKREKKKEERGKKKEANLQINKFPKSIYSWL